MPIPNPVLCFFDFVKKEGAGKNPRRRNMYLNIMCVIFSRKRSIKECICRTHSLLFLAQLAILPTADSESEAREVSFNLPNIGGDPSIRGPPGAWGMGKQCWPGVVKGQKLHPAPHDI